MIGAAVATAARLRKAQVPPLTLLRRDADKLLHELDQLLEHAEELMGDFDGLDPDAAATYLDARAWFLSARLNDLRRQITLAHCELIPRQQIKRREAAMRTAEFLRSRMPIEHRVPRAA